MIEKSEENLSLKEHVDDVKESEKTQVHISDMESSPNVVEEVDKKSAQEAAKSPENSSPDYFYMPHNKNYQSAVKEYHDNPNQKIEIFPQSRNEIGSQ